MASKLATLVDQIRADKGPFFVSRLYLRGKIPTDDAPPDEAAAVRALVETCIELGYDPGLRWRVGSK